MPAIVNIGATLGGVTAGLRAWYSEKTREGEGVKKMGNGKGGGGFFAGLLSAPSSAATAAVLLAQEEARDRLAGKAREAGNFAMDATDDLRGKVNDVTSQWQSSVSEFYERGTQVVERRAPTSTPP